MIFEKNKDLTNLNIGIISYIKRISLESKNVFSVDLYYLREYLLNVLHAKNVDFISKKTRKEVDLSYYKNLIDTNLNEYDELYIYSGNFNIMGGRFPCETLPLIYKLNKYTGKLYYVLADPKFANVDPGINIKHRIKNGKLKTEKGYVDVDIKELDYFSNYIFPKVNIAFTGVDYELYYNNYILNGKNNNQLKYINNNISWFYLDLFGYYSVNEKLPEKLRNFDYETKIYDCVYFGNNRATSRNKIIKDFYNTDKIKTLIIGYNIDFINNDCMEYIKHDDLFNEISKYCYSTLVVGDDLHNNNIITTRFYESMLLDVVAFIYIKYDEEKKYVDNEFLKDFIYVSTPEEMYEKINLIKNDKLLYNKIVELERKEILSKYEKYIKA